MAETTKEQQLRELREARYKKRVTPRNAPLTVTPRVTEPVTPRVTSDKTACPQCLMYEAEIKHLKQQLAKAAHTQLAVVEQMAAKLPVTAAERMRQMRAKRKGTR